MSIRACLAQLADVRRKLSVYGIRDESGYAELLVEKALNGRRHKSGVKKGSDLVAPIYGRIEVRSRTLPLDGRKEARLNLPKSKQGHFEWFAGIVFNSDLSVKSAFLMIHDDAWKCASQNKRNDVTIKAAQEMKSFKLLPRLEISEKELND